MISDFVITIIIIIIIINFSPFFFLVQEVQEEGQNAIDSPGIPTSPDYPPEEYNLGENEERCDLAPNSRDNPKLLELIRVLIEWINDELADQRIIVKDIREDLFDGQILQKLIGRVMI